MAINSKVSRVSVASWRRAFRREWRNSYVQYTMSAKHCSMLAACRSSSLPTRHAMSEHMQASWLMQNMKPCILTSNNPEQLGIGTGTNLKGQKKKLWERSTMMQLSHLVVWMLNSSCNKKRVPATEFPKHKKTWQFEQINSVNNNKKKLFTNYQIC